MSHRYVTANAAYVRQPKQSFCTNLVLNYYVECRFGDCFRSGLSPSEVDKAFLLFWKFQNMGEQLNSHCVCLIYHVLHGCTDFRNFFSPVHNQWTTSIILVCVVYATIGGMYGTTFFRWVMKFVFFQKWKLKK